MNSAILLICADMIAFSQYAFGYDTGSLQST
jgi:hypothetical protein